MCKKNASYCLEACEFSMKPMATILYLFREKIISFAYTVVSVILGHVARPPVGARNCAEC